MDINEEIQTGPTASTPTSAFEGLINVTVCPTTGGQFEIKVSPNDTVENLRKKIARHLQTPHERLKVLFKEKVLSTGQVSEHQIQEGSKVTLLPAVESGFSSTVQGTQQSIIQAIESLSDIQIDDFLSGRSPLTLALRVGDHMMFVQLQLEQSVTNTSGGQASANTDVNGHRTSHRRRPLYDQLSRFPSNSASARTSHSLSHHSSGKNPTNFVTSSSIADIPATSSGSSSNDSSKVSSGSESKVSQTSLLSQSSSVKTSHLDRLETACSSLGKPSVSLKQRSEKPNTQNKGENYQYRRASTTCGKITSGVGSLSHHAACGTGSRMVRQMQRLRRLCGAHQQCVAYSSLELASEISSIVHAAKHSSSESGGGNSCHHRRSGKSSLRERPRPSSGSSSHVSNPNQAPPVAGASIDSVTTHGPGIFSGTFSGSLHPNIQDGEGRPKRDPQTILQILTDLLSATNHYEGQTGNIGMVPQLFKEHLNKQTSASASNDKSPQTNTSEAARTERRHHRQTPHTHTNRTFPAGGFPLNIGNHVTPHSVYSSSLHQFGDQRNRRSSNGLLVPSESVGQRVSGKCPHNSVPPPWSNWCGGRKSRRPTPDINVSRLQQLRLENTTTRQKVEKLQEKMLQRRVRRRDRREACGPYSKRVVNMDNITQPNDINDNADDSSAALEMQIDEMNYAEDRKSEVTHEPAETVTV